MGRQRASGMHGKARLKAFGGQGTRGTHAEHLAHGRDLGRVPAERLVERRCELPSRREGHAMRGEVRARRPEGVRWWRRKRHARGEGPTEGVRVRARAGRTSNMPRMVVTLEVSRLSGWLKACTFCRVEGRGMRCGARCAPGGGRAWGGGGASGMLGEGPTRGCWEPQGTRKAHVEHVVHVRNLGGVKAQQLIERRHRLPSRREGHAMRGEVRARRPEGVRWWRRKRHAHGGKVRLKA